MARPAGTPPARSRLIEPAKWPAWVLGFPCRDSLDPVRHEAIRAAFQQWQRDKAQWRREHTLLDGSGFLLAAAEGRRPR